MKRFLSAILALTFIVTLFACYPVTVSAATYKTGANGASASYKSGKYYAHHQAITLTGDGPTDVLAMAISQLGYQEGNAAGSYSGLSGGSNNYTEYCYNMGDFGSGYGGSAYPWCATFVSWCLLQGGATSHNSMSHWCRNHFGNASYIWREISCHQWYTQLANYTNYWKWSTYKGGSYVPTSGDLIFFANSSTTGHIGFVLYCDGATVYTIEGNTSNNTGLDSNGGGVYYKSYSLGSSYIYGYGHMPYNNISSAKIDYSGSNPTPGQYMTTGVNKYIYPTAADAAAGTNAYATTLPAFTMFNVTSVPNSSVLQINYNGTTGYITNVINGQKRVIQLSKTAGSSSGTTTSGIVNWTSVRTNGSLDAFTTNGNTGVGYAINQWNTASGKVVDILTTNSAGLYGWATFSSSLSKVGYYWDNKTTSITWQSGMGETTEAAVSNLGGIRFHIDAPMSSAPSTGKHTVHYVGQLANGTVVEFESWMMNISQPSSEATTAAPNTQTEAETTAPTPDNNIWDWDMKATGGNLDGFTTNGTTAVTYPVRDWNVASGSVVDIKTSTSAGLYGWAAFSSPLSKVGYYWDKNTTSITWQSNLGATTGTDVTSAGGANAKRFHINTPMTSAPSTGKHTLHYVGQLTDGTLVEFESWVMNVLDDSTSGDTVVTTATKTGGHIDAHTIDGVDAAGSISVSAGQTVGLRGWIGYTIAISQYGYYIGTNPAAAVWTSNPGSDTEDAVYGVGGTYARRYHIQAPTSGLTTGSYSITYVIKLSDGSVQTLGTLTPVITSSSGSGNNNNNTASEHINKLSDDMKPILAENNGTVYEETVMFIEGMTTKTLLYPIKDVLEVKWYNVNNGSVTTYTKGVDYTVNSAGQLVLVPGSSLAAVCMPAVYYNDWTTSPGAAVGNLAGGKYWGEGTSMTNWQVRVTYTTHSSWSGAEQTSYYNTKYQNFLNKLKDGKDVTMVFYGDSITYGANSSFTIGAKPSDGYSYSMLLAMSLADLYNYKVRFVASPNGTPLPGTYTPTSGGTNGTITYINSAVGGWTSGDGVNNYAGYVGNYVNVYGCDLFVCAFGLNDGVGTAATTGANVGSIVSALKSSKPNAAVMIVSSMIANPSGAAAGVDLSGQRAQFNSIAPSYTNTAVVDMTAISQAVYNRKGLYADYSGNNVNHPNDFLHRVYAQTLFEALIGYENLDAALNGVTDSNPDDSGNTGGNTSSDIVGPLPDNTGVPNITAEYRNQLLEAGFPESYIPMLAKLHEEHPNWTFTALDITALKSTYTWDYIINQMASVPDRNLVIKSTWAPSPFTSLGDANYAPYRNEALGTYDSGIWYAATQAAIEYFMDPRNFMNERDVFMFLDWQYEDRTVTATQVEAVLGSSAYANKIIPDLDGKTTYAQYLVQIGTELGVDPMFLAARLVQENGAGTSPLVNGTVGDYLGNTSYNGYYNFYNINASGSGYTQIYTNGAKEAMTGTPAMASAWGGSGAWNTRWKAIYGGAYAIREKYVLKYKNTLYLQKFNVHPSATSQFSGYMQNIAAPLLEGRNFQSALVDSNTLDSAYNFLIPVYSGMDFSPAADPGNGSLYYSYTEAPVTSYNMTNESIGANTINMDTSGMAIVSNWRYTAGISSINGVGFTDLYGYRDASTKTIHPATIDAYANGITTKGNSLTIDGWALANAGQLGYVWSVDGVTWYPCTLGTLTSATVANGNIARSTNYGYLTQVSYSKGTFSGLGMNLAAYIGKNIDVYFGVVPSQSGSSVCHFLTIENLAVGGETCSHTTVKHVTLNETNHSIVCTTCGVVTKASEAHTLNYININASTHSQTCSKCGYVSAAVAHDFTNGPCACGTGDSDDTNSTASYTIDFSVYSGAPMTNFGITTNNATVGSDTINGYLTLTATGANPYVTIDIPSDLTYKNADFIVIKYRTSSTTASAQFFCGSSFGKYKAFTWDSTYENYNSEWKIALVNCNSVWGSTSGNMTKFRFDFLSNGKKADTSDTTNFNGQSVDVSYIKFFSTKAKATAFIATDVTSTSTSTTKEYPASNVIAVGGKYYHYSSLTPLTYNGVAATPKYSTGDAQHCMDYWMGMTSSGIFQSYTAADYASWGEVSLGNTNYWSAFGYYGWINPAAGEAGGGINAPITHVGYQVDNGSIQWQAGSTNVISYTNGSTTAVQNDSAVTSAIGTYARRYTLWIPASAFSANKMHCLYLYAKDASGNVFCLNEGWAGGVNKPIKVNTGVNGEYTDASGKGYSSSSSGFVKADNGTAYIASGKTTVTSLGNGKYGVVTTTTATRVNPPSSYIGTQCAHTYSTAADANPKFYISVEATCTTAGVKYYACTKCGNPDIDSGEITIPSTGHKGAAATCTTAEICTSCGITIQSALGHTYSSTVLSPTCTAGGFTTYSCNRCGSSYTDDHTNALGHKYQVTDSTDPTCTQPGYATYTCSGCGDSYLLENSEALGHTPDVAVYENVIEATATTPGSYDSVVYCSVCDAEMSRETVTVPAFGVPAPTATVKGASVVLGQALGITYNAEVQNATSTPVMKFTVGGKVMAEVEGTYNATNGRYYFELKGINPQCIGDNILAEVYVDGVMIASKDNYSIKAYLVGQLSKSATTEALKTLIYNTLAYGAAAQAYTGYNTGDMINAGYEDKAVSYDMGSIDGSDQGFALTNTRTDVKISGVSVNFGDVNKIMVQYVGNATLYVNGVAVEPASYDALSGKSTYYTDGIYASSLGTIFTFTLEFNGEIVSTMCCSINAYAARQQGKTTANAKLAIALFNYGMAAQAYCS